LRRSTVVAVIVFACIAALIAGRVYGAAQGSYALTPSAPVKVVNQAVGTVTVYRTSTASSARAFRIIMTRDRIVVTDRSFKLPRSGGVRASVASLCTRDFRRATYQVRTRVEGGGGAYPFVAGPARRILC